MSTVELKPATHDPAFDPAPCAQLDEALAGAVERYYERTPKSREHHRQACTAMPGGNTRTILHYDPYPVTLVKGEGATVWDADGNRYTDFIGEYSAGLYGHSNASIKSAINRSLAEGIVLCAPNRYELELANLICSRFPSCDRIRFCNSGTEANLLAVSAARVHTGRAKILVFDGAYHGGVFYFGDHHSPINAPFEYLIGEYNGIDASAELVRNHHADIAAILVEPMQGAGGCIPGDLGFLVSLRELSERHGIVLIFDEVMTSRLSPGGLQERMDVIPDMTTFGKYLGGGLTFGAFGGIRPIMDQFDPRRGDAIPHAGTFNNNVLTMAAGLSGLTELYTPERAVTHNTNGDEFRRGLNQSITEQGVSMHVSGIGTIMCIHFQRQPLRSIADKRSRDPRLRSLFQLEMLLAGFYVSHRGYMSLSLALEAADYVAFHAEFEDFLARHGSLLKA